MANVTDCRGHERTASRLLANVPEDVLRWLEVNLHGNGGVIRISPLPGFGNENFLVITQDGRKFVLRRYLRTDRCGIEAALMTRLMTSEIPVPEIIALDARGDAGGRPLMLRHFTEGFTASDVVHQERPDEVSSIGEDMGTTLAAIGRIVFDRVGFFSGPDLVPAPDERLANLPLFMDDCIGHMIEGETLTSNERRRLVNMIDSYTPLMRMEAGGVLVHADFSLTNIIVGPDKGRWHVRSVLDWEFSFSGSSLYDVGSVLRRRDILPVSFIEHFLRGYTESGGYLPSSRKDLLVILDLSSLVVECLTRRQGNPFFGEEVNFVRRRLLH